MGHGHSHRAGDDDLVEVAALPRTVLLSVLAAALALTVVGLLTLWPDGDEVDDLRGSVSFAAEGVTFPEAKVEDVAPACESLTEPAEGCGTLEVTVVEGADEGTVAAVEVPPQVSAAGLRPGDRVQLIRTPAAEDAPATLAYFGIERSRPLWLLAAAFALVVLLVARFRGLMALVGLGFAGGVVGLFVVPALLVGESPVPVAVVGAVAIMYVVLYTTHGFSIRTSAALAGTLGGIGLTAAIGAWAVGASHLTGVTGEEGGVLTAYAGGLDFQALLVAAVVIAGLGVLNDVTITQASAVWELRGAAPTMTRRAVFASAMRIGRDHIASTIYTIVFAYAGTALLLLLVVSLYDRPLLDLAGTEEIATEVVRSLTSSIGLVLAVPLTTVIAALTVPGPSEAVSTTV
ncbi:YibE/F family protein [Nocardioides dilutus]